jgi:2-oxo-hept-3-ene-1,7-dioate hydratase
MTRTLTDEQVAAVAAAHEAARIAVQPIKRVTLAYPDMNIVDAYANQKAWVDLQIANGAKVVGHKIGLTSKAMQQAMKINEPDFGTLLDYMVISNGATLRAADFVDPKFEVEVAFVLKHALSGTDLTRDDVLNATDYVVGSLELIDARSWRTDPDDKVTRTVRDTISDNAANAGIVCADVHVDARSIDLRWVGAIMKRNGEVEETGLGAGVLDDPALGIVWLARRFAGLGLSLEPRQVILSGSFTRPVDCRAGDRFEVDFGPLGVITCDFV